MAFQITCLGIVCPGVGGELRRALRAKLEHFDARHEAMRDLLGIAELQSMIASTMQAVRRSAVSSSWANAKVGRPRSTPAAASTLLRVLIMKVFLIEYQNLHSSAHLARPDRHLGAFQIRLLGVITAAL